VSAVLAAFTLALIGFADAPAAFAAGTPSIAVNAHAPQGAGLADTGSNVAVAVWAAFALLVVGLAAAVASALARRRGVRR
jgi:hypothetical protein